jgi:hypothetical protein
MTHTKLKGIRIVESDGLFYIQRRYWFFGWRWAYSTETETCIDGYRITERIKFTSVKDALKYLNPPEPRVVFEVL